MGIPIQDMEFITVGISSPSITHTSFQGSPISVTQEFAQAVLFTLAYLLVRISSLILYYINGITATIHRSPCLDDDTGITMLEMVLHSMVVCYDPIAKV